MPTALKIKAAAKPGKPVAASKAAAKASTAPVLGAAAAKQAVAGRSNVVKAGKTSANDKPVNEAPRGLTRDAASVAREATNFDTYSDRDSAYLRFFGAVARQHGGSCTIVQIHNAGVKRNDAPANKRYNPHYAQSGKATDAGAIVRQIKAGYFTRSSDGGMLTATAKAKASELYTGNTKT